MCSQEEHAERGKSGERVEESLPSEPRARSSDRFRHGRFEREDRRPVEMTKGSFPLDVPRNQVELAGWRSRRGRAEKKRLPTWRTLG
jgi:hypothetical protein